MSHTLAKRSPAGSWRVIRSSSGREATDQARGGSSGGDSARPSIRRGSGERKLIRCTVATASVSFVVDMAQPMANAAFYYLEPQARDGFVGWGLFDEALRTLGAAERSVVYPVFKARRLP